ncbi:MAG: ATP-binding protein, partial [Gemmatimonadetes bacterium]|nr:ATP-binding protein [Gemmatimonadota bacterium]NIQ60066.1 ATP-binding protein [Gemmatimonadota bacterium]NIU80274.1 ATP-binding protein [Gammaproteobacteria bacterium]NIX48654.1 ATP-binding protein [Gemmatimonadota bacterium]NIY13101.1 ATP-binding protein [Gemmatimonadota bacterium]
MLFDLDPRFTFDSFVVGDANRPVVDAARRAAVPGAADNPLLICGGSGLGKTHLLNAIGHRAQRLHSVEVAFVTVDHLSGRLDEAPAGGAGLEVPLEETGLLLVDDIQLMEGQPEPQERLLRAWDALSARGGQVVLTSDRDTDRLDDLDDRLRRRLAGGLTVDISPPDYETRVAIAHRKAEERGEPLADGVCEALARIPFTNIRELKGSLNRLIAIQELEDRTVAPGEVAGLLGVTGAEDGPAETEAGAGAEDAEGAAERRLAEAIRAWDGKGYRTGRLEGALIGALTPEEAAEIVRRFERDVERLREVEERIRSLEPESADVARELLRDPARITEAESLLADVRRRRELPPSPP